MTLKKVMQIFDLKGNYDYDNKLGILTIYQKMSPKEFVQLKRVLKAQKILINDLRLYVRRPEVTKFKDVSKYVMYEWFFNTYWY